ncbi:MAG: hypothetical protein IPL33_21090 [Sphingobacteriales bacterium]|nr:hypothetical protein [Sphingobacteriales bacterium]
MQAQIFQFVQGETASLSASGGTSYAWDNGAGMGSPVSIESYIYPTTYTVTVSDANGCTSLDATTVTVKTASTRTAMRLRV